MFEALAAAVASDPRVAYALVFGSATKGTDRPDSDVDVAIGLAGRPLGALECLEFAATLEAVADRRVDLVLLDESPPALAYRIFRDGVVLVDRDVAALTARRARAILEYLDFLPVETLCTRGVLAAAHGR